MPLRRSKLVRRPGAAISHSLPSPRRTRLESGKRNVTRLWLRVRTRSPANKAWLVGHGIQFPAPARKNSTVPSITTTVAAVTDPWAAVGSALGGRGVAGGTDEEGGVAEGVRLGSSA